MVGQCIFCSWYGVRLRRASYVDGGVMYHPHCVRVALLSPDPGDRERAELIVRTETPRLARERFWEINPPNRTANPAHGVKSVSPVEVANLCGAEAAPAVLPGDVARMRLERLAGKATPAAMTALPEATLPVVAEDKCSEARRLCESGVPLDEVARRLALRPQTVALWARNGWQRPRRRARSDVDRAVEMVSRFSDEEMSDFRDRLTRMVRFLVAGPFAEDSIDHTYDVLGTYQAAPGSE